jgi:hypothetical protein
VRPGELRHAEWTEFDLDGQEPLWRIPAEKMKMNEQHVVPLARQALVLLRELHVLTGRGRYVFPSLRSGSRPMSENTVNAALRRMGYTTEEMTGHGFRSLASTCLNEQGYHPDLIELQLAHAERNLVRAAYNKAQRLPERRKMMAAWADYLDGLRAGANGVVNMRSTLTSDRRPRLTTPGNVSSGIIMTFNCWVWSRFDAGMARKVVNCRRRFTWQIIARSLGAVPA